MANSDSSYYILRFDPTAGTIQYFSGADWFDVAIGDAEVLSTPLTGYASTTGTITSADTVLTSIEKLNGNSALKLPLTGGTLSGTLTVNATLNVTGGNLTNSSGNVSVTGAGHGFLALSDGVNADFFWNGSTKQLILGANSADASAKVEIDSTTQGVLFPRMTNTQRDAIATPAEGLTIYSTTDHALEFYNGTTWKQVATV